MSESLHYLSTKNVNIKVKILLNCFLDMKVTICHRAAAPQQSVSTPLAFVSDVL
jgi:hypothetical protein